MKSEIMLFVYYYYVETCNESKIGFYVSHCICNFVLDFVFHRKSLFFFSIFFLLFSYIQLTTVWFSVYWMLLQQFPWFKDSNWFEKSRGTMQDCSLWILLVLLVFINLKWSTGSDSLIVSAIDFVVWFVKRF